MSVITPAYNVGRYLAACLDSVLAQTFPDFEVLVVDDGSVDDTADVLRAYAAQDSRVRGFRGPNRGVSHARNVAMTQARGRYFALLDADDRWAPTWLEAMVQRLEREPDVAIVTGNAVNDGGGALDGRPVRPWPAEPRTLRFLDLVTHEDSVFIMALFRRAVYERIGGFNERLYRSEDYDFWLRAAAADLRIVTHPEPLGWYRRRPDSASADQAAMFASIKDVLVRARSFRHTPRADELAAIDRKLDQLASESLLHSAKRALLRRRYSEARCHFWELYRRGKGLPYAAMALALPRSLCGPPITHDSAPARDRRRCVEAGSACLPERQRVSALCGAAVWPVRPRQKRSAAASRARILLRRPGVISSARVVNLFAWFLVAVGAAFAGQTSKANTVTVPAGGDLQAALDGARPGDVISLEPGATFVGNFVLRTQAGTDRPVVVRTAGAEAVAFGQRMTPERADTLARLRSPNSMPVLSTAPGARGWRIELLAFDANRGGAGDIIALGDGSSAQRSLASVPSDITLDRLYVHGDTREGQKRAIALNAARVVISNSSIVDIAAVGQDSQAIAGWNGPGRYTIENNTIEAAGENILFGGADPSIPQLTPEDIVIRRNHIAKPLAWRQPGTRWQVKNLLELKNARAVRIEENVFEHNWAQAQSGYSILLTVRNQDGGCPWCEVRDVQFVRNTVRDVAAAFQILGTDYLKPSRQTTGVVIKDNVIAGLDGPAWGGDGYLLQMTDGPRDVVLDHNTVIQGRSSGIAKVDGRVDGFVFTNNLVAHGAYGIIASARAPGNDSIRNNLPGARIVGNVIAGGNPAWYPSGNLFPSVDEFRAQFVDAAAGDFRLQPQSPWTKQGTDGRPLGADLRAQARNPASARP
ncbi:MAG: glycosyltransferase [Acidobacteria bacterium]|nr:glycosyltransferase [Acidobacteriota bacterium]